MCLQVVFVVYLVSALMLEVQSTARCTSCDIPTDANTTHIATAAIIYKGHIVIAIYLAFLIAQFFQSSDLFLLFKCHLVTLIVITPYLTHHFPRILVDNQGILNMICRISLSTRQHQQVFLIHDYIPIRLLLLQIVFLQVVCPRVVYLMLCICGFKLWCWSFTTTIRMLQWSNILITKMVDVHPLWIIILILVIRVPTIRTQEIRGRLHLNTRLMYQPSALIKSQVCSLFDSIYWFYGTVIFFLLVEIVYQCISWLVKCIILVFFISSGQVFVDTAML